MCILITCFSGCNVISLKLTLTFLSSVFLKKINILRTKIVSDMEKKPFLIIYKKLLLARDCFRPKSGPFSNIWNVVDLLFTPLNIFHTSGLFLYPLKTLGNQMLTDIFRRYRKRLVAWNGLISNGDDFSVFTFYISALLPTF